MRKTDETPLWVFLAFSSIESRKGALILIGCSFIFSLYCIPWVLFFNQFEWVSTLFLIDDWEWLIMMAPMTAWYALSLRWVDKHSAW